MTIADWIYEQRREEAHRFQRELAERQAAFERERKKQSSILIEGEYEVVSKPAASPKARQHDDS